MNYQERYYIAMFFLSLSNFSYFFRYRDDIFFAMFAVICVFLMAYYIGEYCEFKKGNR